MFDAWFITFYNVLFTSLPVMALGILDQDVDDVTCFKYPKLYVPGQRNRLFNNRIFILSLANGVMVASLLYFFTYGVFDVIVNENGKDAATLNVFGTVLAGSLVFVVNLQVRQSCNLISFEACSHQGLSRLSSHLLIRLSGN